ncbi:MAG: 16S rRNA (guanine(966)-N(2))-methyltransferase RsmD [bacterium]|nr:16S rRNA (guanine(966)-N(2))-methyltransferase RsmD [bacterium]
MLRVIAGSAKGRKLKLVPGDTTRPIMDRVKEALFSIIGRDVLDASFLDLFAGTGSVGIEALSRGAKQAVFIDTEPKAIQTINDNLKITGLAAKASVRRTDGFIYLSSRVEQPYDFIYIAPPQYKEMWQKALRLIDAKPTWLTPEGTVIVQIDPEEFALLELQALVLDDERRYGSTLLLFYSLKATELPSTAPSVASP